MVSRELNTGFSSRPMTDVTISLDGGRSQSTYQLLDHGLSHKFYRDAILTTLESSSPPRRRYSQRQARLLNYVTPCTP